ncbi:MAG: hypothetical protein J5608_00725 [Alphaproteobacteria bacterium]|nr:hypothetical protein [Alphaproteobacteria bacterium]
MKKLLLLLPIITLAACDRPTSIAELDCSVDENWKTEVTNIKATDWFRDETTITMTAKTYDDYIKLTVNNKTSKLDKILDSQHGTDFTHGNVIITYQGQFPDSERQAHFYISADTTNQVIKRYSISFDAQQYFDSKFGEYRHIKWNCYPNNPKFRKTSFEAAVPFKHHYSKPTNIEKCITEICATVYCTNNNCDKLQIMTDDIKQILTPEEALSISQNWDYSNMKRYINDGKLEEHEKDACTVLEKLNKFIQLQTQINADKYLDNMVDKITSK